MPESHREGTSIDTIRRYVAWTGELGTNRNVSYDPPLAGVNDFSIPKCVAGADEAIAVIREYYANWRTGNQTE